MEFAQFEDWFSTARVNRYWKATNSSGKQAMNLYKANIEVSKALYPLLSIFEIILRNKMDAVLSAAISEDWIYLVKDGRFGTQIPFKNVNDVFNKLPRPIAPTKDRIISELTFGFWTSLFETTNYKHFKGTPIKVFHPYRQGMAEKKFTKNLMEFEFSETEYIITNLFASINTSLIFRYARIYMQT